MGERPGVGFSQAGEGRFLESRLVDPALATTESQKEIGPCS